MAPEGVVVQDGGGSALPVDSQSVGAGIRARRSWRGKSGTAGFPPQALTAVRCAEEPRCRPAAAPHVAKATPTASGHDRWAPRHTDTTRGGTRWRPRVRLDAEAARPDLGPDDGVEGGRLCGVVRELANAEAGDRSPGKHPATNAICGVRDMPPSPGTLGFITSSASLLVGLEHRRSPAARSTAHPVPIRRRSLRGPRRGRRARARRSTAPA
jgi:hypothetical protein